MKGKVRLQLADRNQLLLVPTDLDRLVPLDHEVRSVWRFVGQLDLSPLHEAIRAREGHPGRPPIDPAILFCLWLYATLEGLGRRESWSGWPIITTPIAGFAAG